MIGSTAGEFCSLRDLKKRKVTFNPKVPPQHYWQVMLVVTEEQGFDEIDFITYECDICGAHKDEVVTRNYGLTFEAEFIDGIIVRTMDPNKEGE